MARPPRADEASTRHVGFRLTDDEIERLDHLVLEHGLSDRSALMRAWLEHDGPTKRKPLRASQATPAPKPASTSRTSKHAETVSRIEIHPRTNHRQTPRNNANATRSSNPVATAHIEPIPARRRHPRITAMPRTMDSSPSRDESSRETPKSIMRELLAELHRHKDPHLGLIRVVDVVRALLPLASLDAVHDALLTLAKHGTIELRPDGGTEFLKADDAAICPRGPRDTMFAYARLIEPR